MKVVVGSNHLGDDFPKRLSDTFADVEFITAFEPAEQLAAASDADVFLGWPDRATFLAAENLRWIACPGTGIDKRGSSAHHVSLMSL